MFFFFCVLCLQFSLYFCLLQCLLQCSFRISPPVLASMLFPYFSSSACFNALSVFLLQCLLQCSFRISPPVLASMLFPYFSSSACFNALFIAHFLVLFFDLACLVPLCFFTLICTLHNPSPWFCYVHTD